MARRKATVIVYRSAGDGQWYWRAVASNGRTVADSGEGYSTCGNALRGLAGAQRALAFHELEVAR